MRARKILAIICYTVCILAFFATGYVSFISWRGDISFELGFLIFLPIWIVTYWFSTFFAQLIAKKDGEETVWIFPKKARRILSFITNLFSIAVLGFWIYVYATEYILSTR